MQHINRYDNHLQCKKKKKKNEVDFILQKNLNLKPFKFEWHYRLNFDNSAYRYIMKEDEEEQEILPITSDFFFEVFPFNTVFRQVIPLVIYW